MGSRYIVIDFGLVLDHLFYRCLCYHSSCREGEEKEEQDHAHGPRANAFLSNI